MNQVLLSAEIKGNAMKKLNEIAEKNGTNNDIRLITNNDI